MPELITFVVKGSGTRFVVELNHEELATDEDIAYGIDKWVRLFKAKTWKELKMIAQDNEYLASTASLHISQAIINSFKKLHKNARILFEYKPQRKKTATQAANISDQTKTISDQAKTITSLTDENSRLKKLLDDNGIKHD